MKPYIRVISAGSGDPAVMNETTRAALRSADCLVLRTARHGLVGFLAEENISFLSMDEIYEQADDFDGLSRKTAAALWDMALKRNVTYAVTDILTDQTVAALFRMRPENGKLELISGTGLTDLFLPLIYPMLTPDAGLRTVSASDFRDHPYDPSVNCLVTEMDGSMLAGEVKSALNARLEDETPVLFLRDASTRKEIQLFELDRQKTYDHQTAVFIPARCGFPRDHYRFEDLPDVLRAVRSVQQPFFCAPSTAMADEMKASLKDALSALEKQDAVQMPEAFGKLLSLILHTALEAEKQDEWTPDDLSDAACRELLQRKPC